ncbi:hypothetical protein DWF00_13690 [Bosea caraganae]|uniref:Cytochrome-c oxidase n=1 Tax=Bosea caraganae TaxID=2763117 RepID=A0A370KXC3_9HYPH|nr:hypothetical protein [Bosea caraganae]RDJ19644.1 hypothetical protein DWE98_28720 [Bosea caraganae]RDJ26502.1 hypothetical protein DWF00_13690 [Bosea caraganae]
MSPSAPLFLRLAPVLALLGMCLGIVMGISQDHRLQTLHAHVNLIGWVSMFLAGLYYRLVPAADGRLAYWHFGLATLGLASLGTGLAGLAFGERSFEPFAVVGSLLTIAAMAVFAWIVARTS